MLSVPHYVVHSKHLTTFQDNVGSYTRTKNPKGIIWENIEEKAHLSYFKLQTRIWIF